jgi:hypothetical protein
MVGLLHVFGPKVSKLRCNRIDQFVIGLFNNCQQTMAMAMAVVSFSQIVLQLFGCHWQLVELLFGTLGFLHVAHFFSLASPEDHK